MVGVHQPCTWGDDAVSIGIRVIGERDGVAVLEADEPRHRVGAGAVHSNRAVVVDGHERESRIDQRIDDLDVQPIDLVDRLPVMHGGAAERVDGELEPGAANSAHVDDIAQVVDVGKNQVFLPRRLGVDRSGERHSLYRGVTIL
jgi:hypothetical protein